MSQTAANSSSMINAASQEPMTSPAANEVLAPGVIPSDQSMMAVPLSRIRRNPSIDPRQHRNKARWEDMLASFKRDGIIQAITIRPVTPSEEGGPDFEVVAGNSRFEGAQIIGLSTIPALIRHVSARQAMVLAGVENMKRQDLSPVEEGLQAARLLAAHNNDHAEVCKLLDWTEGKLKSRIMLTHVNPSVQNALVQGDLKIGHVELLAGVPKDHQDKIAAKIIAEGLSVAETKERLSKATRQLSKACFDLSGCQGCRFNSSTMMDMFASAEGAKKDFCINATCWDDKTSKALQIIATDAKESYGTVLRQNEVAADGHVLLEAHGSNGVGESQKSSCASCQHYGCIISTTFGSEGQIMGERCFNLECHAEKVTAYRTLITQAESSTAPTSDTLGSASAASTTNDAAPAPAPATASSSAASKSKKAPAAPAPLTAATLKRGIKQEAMTRFVRMGEEAIAGSERLGMAIALLTLHASLQRDYTPEIVARAAALLEQLTINAQALPPINPEVTDNKALLLARLSVEELTAATTALAALTVWRRDQAQELEKHAPHQNAVRYAQARKINRAKYLAMTAEYFKAQTKAGIVEDCQRSGFAAAYDEMQGENAFQALSKGKAGDLIAAIEAFVKEGHFDFHGYEPLGFAPDFYYQGV